QKEPEEAYKYARKHIHRDLRTALWRWLPKTLSADQKEQRIRATLQEGAARRDGEQRLLIERFGDRIVAFLESDTLHWAVLSSSDGDGFDVLQLVLHRFRRQLSTQKSLRVIWTRLLANVRLAATPLPRSGRPLVDHFDVAWTLDLPRRAPIRALSSRSISIIDTPKGIEPKMANKRSIGPSRPWSVMLTASPHILLFGHGASDQDPFGSRLLIGPQPLTPALLFKMPTIPRVTGLFACESGTRAGPGSKRTEFRHMSLAQAFLLAGSDAVIASHGFVEESQARRWMKAWRTASAAAKSPSLAFMKAARTRGVAKEDFDLWTR
ncbi:MAG: CHAT domain-containing protein, partial [Myxococcota bacterium]